MKELRLLGELKDVAEAGVHLSRCIHKLDALLLYGCSLSHEGFMALIEKIQERSSPVNTLLVNLLMN